jgi:hypothetical protein
MLLTVSADRKASLYQEGYRISPAIASKAGYR